MWLQLSSKNRPVLVNAERLLRIVELSDSEGGPGCALYYSADEFLFVDQRITEIMQRLGFEPRGG